MFYLLHLIIQSNKKKIIVRYRLKLVNQNDVVVEKEKLTMLPPTILKYTTNKTQ